MLAHDVLLEVCWTRVDCACNRSRV